MASLTALSVAYLGGITSVSGAITAGITATAGIAFYGMSQVIGSLGTWEAFIGGVLLIFTAIANPEGIAGAIRQQTAMAKAKKEREKAAAAASMVRSSWPESWTIDGNQASNCEGGG